MTPRGQHYQKTKRAQGPALPVARYRCCCASAIAVVLVADGNNKRLKKCGRPVYLQGGQRGDHQKDPRVGPLSRAVKPDWPNSTHAPPWAFSFRLAPTESDLQGDAETC
eukprot:gnl/TRDRNA2_/TRDRNA2_175833_c1_seq2.p2 gnl/TRDRNA2_/TRDRNA2_175833_c1~~gnl/TRDRNA2_/TRDRNA2_175833_c1_seq2.p2  ORF type:complete len:109 (+),score=4.28 gnl/TRDRNA2_/TRDRNA2_175833_c1_seq2:243-569(+)